MLFKKAMIVLLLLALAACKKEEDTTWTNGSFEEAEKAARDSVVTFYMWGGSEMINKWVDEYIGGALKEQYNMELKRVPMDASVFVNKLITEKAAEKETGEIDLVWINGENFKNARKAGVLYGPFLDKLPNYRDYVDPKSTESDAGFPVEGYEAPYGKAQFNFIYDTAITEAPPINFQDLLSWVKENPGQFTYPQPPDFTGSAFIRQAFYALTGGYEQYSKGFNQELYNKNSPLLWEYLNEMEPWLWQEGTTYPKDKPAQDTLFEKGEVAFTMSFTQTFAQSRINEGRFPYTVSSFLLQDGSLTNTHFVAIPFNSPNKAGALVLANLLLSPEAQLSKNNPVNWGDFTVLSQARLSKAMKTEFENLDLGKATLPLIILDQYAVPEISSEYWEALEKDWETYVLKK